MSIRAIYFFGIFLTSFASNAATIIADNGVLTGVNGIDVLGTRYDVRFVDGAYEDVYSGRSPVFFGNSVEAGAASNAIFQAIEAEGPFINSPTSVNGCTWWQLCAIYTPLSIESGEIMGSWALIAVSDFDSIINIVGLTPDLNSTQVTYTVYSVSVVPIPAAVWLFGSALGLLGWTLRKEI